MQCNERYHSLVLNVLPGGAQWVRAGQHQAPGPNSITPRIVNCAKADWSWVPTPNGTKRPLMTPACEPWSQSLSPGWGGNETAKSFLETACEELCRFGNIGGASSSWWLFVLKVKISHAIKSKSLFWQMEKQRIFAWKRTKEGRQPGCSGGSASEQLGMGLWAGTQQVMTLLHSHHAPQGKPSPLLQIVQGWDKEAC